VYAVDDLPALLPRAEIVVVLLPLTPETTGCSAPSCSGACGRERCS